MRITDKEADVLRAIVKSDFMDFENDNKTPTESTVWQESLNTDLGAYALAGVLGSLQEKNLVHLSEGDGDLTVQLTEIGIEEYMSL